MVLVLCVNFNTRDIAQGRVSVGHEHVLIQEWVRSKNDVLCVLQ